MNSKIISALTLSILLIGCSDSEQTQTQESTDVAAESSTDVAPQASVDTMAAETETKSLGNWQVWESRDPMTDELSKTYTLVSNESPRHKLLLGCSKGGDLNFYLSVPHIEFRNLVTNFNQKGSIRVDNGPVVEEKMWLALFQDGSDKKVVIDNARSFYEKIKDGSLLAISFVVGDSTYTEYNDTLTKNTYNITGIENAVADMEATVCRLGE